jgi:predicted esterase
VLGAPGGRTKELWIACHGYGQLAGSFAKALVALEHDSRVVVVPEALSRFYLDEPNKHHGPDSPVGATWMTREDREREIADYVEYLDLLTSTMQQETGGPPVPVVALGFSQGAATTARWAALGRTKIDRLILWGNSLPADLPTDRGNQLFRGASVVMVVGLRDSQVSAEAIARDQVSLTERGIAARIVRFDGGHALNSDTLRALAAGASSVV